MAKIKKALTLTNKYANPPEVTASNQNPEVSAPEVTATEQTPEVNTPEPAAETENQDVENTEWVSAGETSFESVRGDYKLVVEKQVENLWAWITTYKDESINPRRSNNMASSLRLAKKFAEQAFELHRPSTSSGTHS